MHFNFDDSEVDAILYYVDRDRDGRISFKEFCNSIKEFKDLDECDKNQDGSEKDDASTQSSGSKRSDDSSKSKTSSAPQGRAKKEEGSGQK